MRDNSYGTGIKECTTGYLEDAFATSQGSSSQMTPKLIKNKIIEVKNSDANVDVYQIEASSYMKCKKIDH